MTAMTEEAIRIIGIVLCIPASCRPSAGRSAHQNRRKHEDDFRASRTGPPL